MADLGSTEGIKKAADQQTKVGDRSQGSNMPKMWKPGTLSVEMLLEKVQAGQLALPQFQRPAVWGKSNWLPFLSTLLLGQPTGTLLLLDVGKKPDTFASRALEDAPQVDTDNLETLLLDGQQRTTTLFRAQEGKFGREGAWKEVIVRVQSAIQAGELREEHLELMKCSDVPTPAQCATEGFVAFRTLFSAAHTAGWSHSFGDSHGYKPEHLVIKLNEVAPGFLDLPKYEFPTLEINSETPLDVVVSIFEGMNRRGQRLNQFDLMVAKLYRPIVDGGAPYQLRERWEAALSAATNLTDLGVDEDDGMLPLQLIALQVSRLGDPARGRVKGLNNKDVLELEPAQVTGAPEATIPGVNLEAATEALNHAAKFLTDFCGVAGEGLLPQQAMLLPLADQFLRPGQRLSDAQLKRWFFAAGLNIDYYGSVNSFAQRDADQLALWAEGGNEPLAVRRLTASLVDGLKLKEPFSREGNILGRTLMALLVANNALDWRTGQISVTAPGEEIELHHMVPEQTLKAWYPNKGDRRPIAALTPVTASRNKAMRDKAPLQVLSEIGPEADEILRTHHVDRALLEAGVNDKDSYEKHLNDREERLRAFVKQALGLQ